MKELFEIIQNTLTTNLHVVIAYAALIAAILFRYKHILDLRRENNKTMKIAIEIREQLTAAEKENKRLTAERQGWLKQLKQEREMKGVYSQQLEDLKKSIREAA